MIETLYHAQDILTLPGAILHYKLCEGSADPDVPTLVFLHGWSGAAREWDSMLAQGSFQTADGATLPMLTYDARGFGASALNHGDTADFSNERYVADLLALLDHLHIQRAILVGHSWGAVIAMCTAADHPERVAGLVALNPAYFDPDNRMHRALARVSYGLGLGIVKGRGLLQKSARLRRLAVRRYTARPLSPADSEMVMGDALAADPRAIIGTLVGGYEVRFKEICPRIVAPTLYFAAGRDPVAPAVYVMPFVDLTPGAHYILLKECGHLPMLEAPHATRAAIAQIIALCD